ncbi:hypothetical protein PanWU01x14_213440 [Parasponia andersonii]|uniref:Transmembrane protein n=1 Tax=Parasponia andersonii TaxID=3476 RepID=A0A2P5BSQ8_PARAD|nr:hypothetical protein PanWU01x14_213440 [Parasponia andersonii]
MVLLVALGVVELLLDYVKNEDDFFEEENEILRKLLDFVVVPVLLFSISSQFEDHDIWKRDGF